ncbi:MAG: hypothetical protein JJT99_00155 [Rhodobacteraceae bacterium]|nr:hypothetical protein [Paracoccaceae bacterium]
MGIGCISQRLGIGLSLTLMLAGCMGMAPAPRVISGTPPAGLGAPQGLAQPGSDARIAEQACIDAAEERGLQVQGVAGSRAVTGSDGSAARDVMLRVSRNGTQIELRCNYQASTQMARIMLI